MSGVLGMKHKPKLHSPEYAALVRDRIKAGGIVFRLHQHIVGKVAMTPSQVTAALGLLKKVVPDLASVEHKGEVEHKYVARTPEVMPDTEAWKQQYAPTNLQ
jgi:hypothetical protein